jgi:hypothetical protein
MKMKVLSLVAMLMVICLVAFQNCNKSGLTSAVSSATESTSSSSTGTGGGGGEVLSTLSCGFSKTLNGSFVTSVNTGETVYGRCTGFSSTGVRGCVEIAGVTDNACNNVNVGYTDLPNPASAPMDWKYSSGNYISQFVIPADFAGKTFRFFTYDSRTSRSFTIPSFSVAAAASVTCGFVTISGGNEPVFGGSCNQPGFSCDAGHANQTANITCQGSSGPVASVWQCQCQ